MKLSSILVVTLGALFADADQTRISQFKEGESSYEMRHGGSNISSDASSNNSVNRKKNLKSNASVQAGLEEFDIMDLSRSLNEDDNECIPKNTINFQTDWIPPMVITNYPIKRSIFGYYYFHTTSLTPTGVNAPWKFAKILEFVPRKVGSDYYKVEVIDAETAIEYLSELQEQSAQTNLTFFIPGLNNKVEYVFCAYSRMRKYTKSLVIPVLWNADYFVGQRLLPVIDSLWSVPLSGKALAQLYDPFFQKIQTQKNVICHSAGCLLAQTFAFTVGDNYQDMVIPGHFNNLFMVAAFVRDDLFNEWPEESGKGKNLCLKDKSDKLKYWYCRPGGATAILKMTDKIVVIWNENDKTLLSAENSTSTLNDISPLVVFTKSLGRYGDGTGPNGGVVPLEEFRNDVSFISVFSVNKTSSHEYHVDDFMFEYYD